MRFAGLTFWLGLLPLVLSCAGAPSDPITPTVMEPGIASPRLSGRAVSCGLTQTQAMGLYELRIDPETMTATIAALPERSGQQTDDLYALSLGMFLPAPAITVLGISGSASDLTVRYRVAHPFPAPANPAGTPTASTNRADLGFAGLVLFLADDPGSDNLFFTDRIANTEFCQNPDGYLSPGPLLELSGSANLFPFQQVVHEIDDSREGVSNGGEVTGNFGPDGWTRAELGATRDGWTGYGVLHGGQSSARSVNLNLDAIEGEFGLFIAILARYNDPRGGTTLDELRANRLPPDAPDAARFAYRMPHGALDIPQITVYPESGGFKADTVSSSTLRLHLVDWDARAIETTAADLSQDPAVGTVSAGEAGDPVVEVCLPGVLGDATVKASLDGPFDDDSEVGGDAALDSGRPGDALFYKATVLKPALPGQPDGPLTGMIRVTDPEPTNLATELTETLAPVGGAGPVRTYQAIRVQQESLVPARFVQTWGAIASAPGGSSHPSLLVQDEEGNWLIGGGFGGAIDCDPGPAEFRLDATPTGSYSIFLMSLTATGEFRWARAIGRLAPVYDPNLVALMPGSNGSSLVIGRFQATTDFDPGPAVVERTPVGERDSFVLSLNAAGEFIDVTTFGGLSASADPRDVARLPNGNWLLLGNFGGAVDFDPGPGLAEVTSVGYDGFLLELSPENDFVSVTTWGGPDAHFPFALEVSQSGSVAIAGWFSGTVDFAPGEQTESRTSLGGDDAFCLLLDPDRTLAAVKTWGATSDDWAKELSWDESRQRLSVSGTFNGTVDFASPGDPALMRTSLGLHNCFILNLDTGLRSKWVYCFGGSSSAYIMDQTINQDGTLIVVGSHSGSIDFDPGTNPAFLPHLGIGDIYVLTIAPDGTYDWVTGLGSTSEEYAAAVTTTPSGRIFAAGVFRGTLDFDPGPGVLERTPTGYGAFLWSLQPDGTF